MRHKTPIHVLALPGSLRRASHTTALLRAAKALAPAGVDVTLYQGLADLPPYDQDCDVDVAPAEVQDLRGAIARADAVLLSTPEYNASIPGQLKNALDWASRPYPANALRDKPVAVIGASTGTFGAARAQGELRMVLSAIGARVIDCGLAIGRATDALDADGRPADARQRDRLARIVHVLAEAARSGPSERAA
jgi:chromate reductase, NAD(P)H dehydrogenase (quinone)